MMLKFERNFRLTIDDTKTAATFLPPLKIVFECSKNFDSFGYMNLKIYNLTRSNQTKFTKDPSDSKILNVTLEVGYGKELQILFTGSVYRGFIAKEGVDTAVNLQVLDGGKVLTDTGAFIVKTVLTKQEAFETIVNSMPNVSINKITEQQTTTRPIVLVGNPASLLKEQVDPSQNWLIDEGKLSIISEKEVLKGYIPVVSPETGLKNTPERENLQVSFTTMMNPAIKLGCLCQLISTTAAYLNGVYKVFQMVVRGDNYGEEWGQTITGILAEGYKKI